MRHLLGLQNITKDEICDILNTASAFKEVLARPVKKVPTLRGRSVITLFYEASTRTRTSFETAAKIMSADAINIAVAQSSVIKGESLKDTLLTLQALQADCIIIRHSSSGAAELASRFVNIPVINAGDGRHEHPTQGLLDMLTILSHIGPTPDETCKYSLRGRTVSIVGDLAHSRVARSNVWGLTKLGANVRWVGPKTLIPSDAQQLPITVHTDLREGIEDADVVMVLRLQTERQEKGLLPSLREYARVWGITTKTLEAAKPGVLVMHPGPMNRGVEISADVADGVGGIRSAIEEQVTNGVAVRMACLYHLMGCEGELATEA